MRENLYAMRAVARASLARACLLLDAFTAIIEVSPSASFFFDIPEVRERKAGR
jgi:hypothetical protein